jgi:hypothetical protein
MPSSLASLRPRQRPPTSGRRLPAQPSAFLKSYLDTAEDALAKPFKGITSDGHIVPGLFPLQRTGVSTQPIREAAEAFLTSLSRQQQSTVLFTVDSDAWRRWSNIHPFVMRHGLSFEDMSSAQRERALALLRASLSLQGYAAARDVMRLNEVIRDITKCDDEYGEWLYWLSLMGRPSADEPWGWQIDGHHLIINCFVLGEQVVMTPLFMGSEPVAADTGPYAGTRVFDAEESAGLTLMHALTAEQQHKTILAKELPRELFTTAYRDNYEMRYEGIGYTELSGPQQHLLGSLIDTYVGRMQSGHARVKMDEVKRHLSETYFSWMGGCDEDSVFYYRVHSPVILIEFDHQRGVALDNDEPSRDHIHTVVRTPNGNDYGKDLLRQHYEQCDHAHPQHRHAHAPAGSTAAGSTAAGSTANRL